MSKRDTRWEKETGKISLKFERVERDEFSFNAKVERTDKYQKKMRNKDRDRRREYCRD